MCDNALYLAHNYCSRSCCFASFLFLSVAHPLPWVRRAHCCLRVVSVSVLSWCLVLPRASFHSCFSTPVNATGRLWVHRGLYVTDLSPFLLLNHIRVCLLCGCFVPLRRQFDMLKLRNELISLYTVDSIRRVATECIVPMITQVCT